MSACPARDLCADMAAHPHRVAAAAQGSTHVEYWTGPGAAWRRARFVPAIAGHRPKP